MTSYVYVSTNTPDPIDLTLKNCGPDPFPVSLSSNRLNPQSNGAKVMSIPRSTSSIAMLDVVFSMTGNYIGSFGILIRGHDIGSSIWWRLRTAGSVLYWVGDRDPHSTQVRIGNTTFELSIQGDSSFLGDDDLLVILRSVN